MPVEVGIWKLGDRIERVAFLPIDSEAKLEDTLAKDISILSPDLMLIGRQVPTAHGGFIDLLAIDIEGSLSVIELKKQRTPREVVAQALDYASWVQTLTYEDIASIYSDNHNGRAIEEAFASAFESDPPDKLNQSHQIVVVCSELDASTERIINYLSDSYGVPINAVFFRFFRQNGEEFLTRSWLIDPVEAVTRKDKVSKQETWNGRDFYVSFGESEVRNWEDAMKYGFVCGGGGAWYSRTLQQLEPNNRIFVCIPQTGYVGVGIVTEPATPIQNFKVKIDGKEMPILEAPLKATEMNRGVQDLETCEHLVRVNWIKTLPRDKAIWEKGMFANQNTVCKLRNRFTLERLIQHFALND